jgi:uncharacterized membrane protein YqaE (UPF0057 family)
MKKINTFLLGIAMLGSYTLSAAAITEPTSKTTTETTAPKEVLPDDVVVTDALREFKSLSRVDRKMRMHEVKKTIKEYKAAKKAGDDVNTNTLLLAILAILLPPLAVGLHEHALNGKFWLSVLLTLLFWLPGVIYALFVVLS